SRARDTHHHPRFCIRLDNGSQSTAIDTLSLHDALPISFTKSGSATTSTISTTFNSTGTVGVPNSGTVNVQSGTLNLSGGGTDIRSEEHTSELQPRRDVV